MPEIAPFLWFEKDAGEAAELYVSLVPDSRIESVTALPSDSPSGPAGSVKIVAFTLAGRPHVAFNGGKLDSFNHAVSLFITCDTQDEIDRIWDGFLNAGGEAQQCGWLKDRWGLYWQIVPRALLEMMKSPDRARAARAMEAMMKMIKLDIAALKRAYDG